MSGSQVPSAGSHDSPLLSAPAPCSLHTCASQALPPAAGKQRPQVQSEVREATEDAPPQAEPLKASPLAQGDGKTILAQGCPKSGAAWDASGSYMADEGSNVKYI